MVPKASDIEAWSKCFPRGQLGDALGVRMGWNQRISLWAHLNHTHTGGLWPCENVSTLIDVKSAQLYNFQSCKGDTLG